MRAVFLVCFMLAVFGATSGASGHFFTAAGESAKDVVNRHLDLLKKVIHSPDRREKLPNLVILDAGVRQPEDLTYYAILNVFSNLLLESTVIDASFEENGNIIIDFKHEDYPDNVFKIPLIKKASDPKEWFFVIPSIVRDVMRRRRPAPKVQDYEWCLVYGLC